MQFFFGVAGLISGIAIPTVSDKIIQNKCIRNKKEIPDHNFWKWYTRGISIILNTIFWTLAGLFLENPVSAFLISVLCTLSILFAVIDLQIRLIPNEMVLFTMAVGGMFQLIQYGFKSFLIAIACMLGMILLFLLVGFIVGLGKVGAGDIKLAGAMGLSLGYPAIFNGALVMSVVIIAYCFIGVWFRKLTMVTMFPFAPFMMIGMVSSLGIIILNFF